MSELLDRARSLTTSILHQLRGVPAGAARIGHGRGDARAKAICPVDSWTFTPLYSDGHCPICGWAPEAYVYRPPLLAPYERYWGAMAGIVAVSLAMCLLVVSAYTHG